MIYKANYTLDIESKFTQIIKVIGVGGAGGNAVAHMNDLGIHDVDLVICNTDVQVLHGSKIQNKLQIGAKLTKGLGAGTQPEIGKNAAIESEKQIKELLETPTEMVFITAGMGGGTGTGAAPVIAKIAKEMGLLTIAVVTDPFDFEGEEKIMQARKGIEELKEQCDTVLIIKNSRLESMFGDMRITQAYAKADDVLANAVKSIAELITRPGIINLDFADVKMVLKGAGQAVMGSFEAEGADRAKIAIKEALNSPLLENDDIYGAKRVMVSIAYSDEKEEYIPTMKDQAAITKFVEDEIKKDKNNKAKIFKLGYAVDPNLGGKVRVTVVAAGFDLPDDIVVEQPKVIVLEPEKQVELPKEIFTDFEVKGNPLNPSNLTTHTYEPKQKARVQERIIEKTDSEQIQRMIDHFVKQSYSLHDLSRPSFVRNSVNLVDLRSIKAKEDFEVFDLQDLYEGLIAEKVLC
jgi:cell division protein FtsZ